MTHSNHRRGTRESLMGDWVVLTTDARPHAPENLRKYVEILMRHNPVALATRRFEGDKTTRYRYVRGWDKSKDSGIFKGTTLEEMRGTPDLRWGSAVYTSFDDVKAVLSELKEADLGVSVTGVAGPTGGTLEKPVGLVYIALSTPDVETCERHVWSGDRLTNKEQSADAALQLILGYLHGRGTT